MKVVRPSVLPLRSLQLILPLLIFSYYPLIQLGTLSGTHIDLSLLYVAVLAIVAINTPMLWKNRRLLQKNLPLKLFVVFIIYVWLSTIWSANPTRAVITASFLTLMLGLFSTVVLHHSKLLPISKHLRTLLYAAFVLAGALAIWQIIADAVGISHQLSLLPTTYSGAVFGIARPTSFALEPQFFGNLLLLPLLYSAYTLLAGSKKTSDYVVLLASSCLLLLTLSRGALLAGVIGIVILLIVTRAPWRTVLRLVLVGILSLGIIITMTLGVAALREDNISSTEAVRRITSQLSLGVLPIKQPVASRTDDSKKIPTQTDQSTTGYVTSSTDSRISMSGAALDVWQTGPSSVGFGVGIGGFGATLHDNNRNMPVGSVVNNFYLETLAELGIAGILLFVAFIISILLTIRSSRQYLLLALVVAFLVQWSFFSGTANVVHIWIIFALAASAVRFKQIKSAE